MAILFSATLHHMMTLTCPDTRDANRALRVVIIVCALITLLVMQSAVLKHAFDHLAASPNKVSSHVLDAQSQLEQADHVAVSSLQSDLPQGITCQKCLEDVAHAFVMPSIAEISHTALTYEMVRAALPHNLPSLSPERANQRAPPAIL